VSLYYYEAFGNRLASTIPLPELRPTEQGPFDWRFRVVERLEKAEDVQPLGEEPIYGSVSARLMRHSRGYRIEIDDTGVFDLADNLREIRWQPTADPWWDFGRSHLIGRVLGTALQLAGTITLHASAVEMEDGVVGFLAPKHFGKSTLAMMLFQAGARFVTDDSLAVDHEDGVRARPGIQSLRVRVDDPNVERLVGPDATATPGRDGKAFLPPFPADRVMGDPSAISGLYFLRPEAPSSFDGIVERRRLPGVAAAIRLMGETKIGAMLGGGFAPALLEAVTAIASSVPVYELSIVRDIDAMPEVVERLVGWHGLAAASRSLAHAR
jgi:hypothetical protein